MITEPEKKNLLERFSRIEGQIRGVRKMIEDQRYCPDILNQVAAVRRALDSVSLKVIESHMNTCVSNAIRKNKGKDSISELIDTVERFIR